MNIGVYIATGGINTLITNDSIIDQLAALDQAESQFRSENTVPQREHQVWHPPPHEERQDAPQPHPISRLYQRV